MPTNKITKPTAEDAVDVFAALSGVIGHTGATELTIAERLREDDEPADMPTIYTALAFYRGHRPDAPTLKRPVMASATNATFALGELAEKLVDGGTCMKCERPLTLTLPWDDDMELPTSINGTDFCPMRYYPSIKKFVTECRRG